MKNIYKTVCFLTLSIFSFLSLEASCKWRTLPSSPYEREQKEQAARVAAEQTKIEAMQIALQAARDSEAKKTPVKEMAWFDLPGQFSKIFAKQKNSK